MWFDERLELLLTSGQATQQTIDVTRVLLAKVEAWFEQELQESSGAMLLTHLATTSKRLLDGEVLSEPSEGVWAEIQQYPELITLARDLVREMSSSFQTDIAESEVAFMAVHLAVIQNQLA